MNKVTVKKTINYLRAEGYTIKAPKPEVNRPEIETIDWHELSDGFEAITMPTNINEKGYMRDGSPVFIVDEMSKTLVGDSFKAVRIEDDITFYKKSE